MPSSGNLVLSARLLGELTCSERSTESTVTAFDPDGSFNVFSYDFNNDDWSLHLT